MIATTLRTAWPALTAMAAIGTLYAGLREFRAAQRWRRLEFAASILEEVHANEEFRLATTFLDWRDRWVKIPERFGYQPEIGSLFRHTHHDMVEAFEMERRERVRETGDVDVKLNELTPERIIYIEVFDRFFEYLQQLNDFASMGVISSRDTLPVRYWALRIYQFKYNGRYAFRKYLEHFQYGEVLELMRSFEDDRAVFPFENEEDASPDLAPDAP